MAAVCIHQQNKQKKKKNLKNNSVLKNRETVLDQDSSDLPSMSIQMHT